MASITISSPNGAQTNPTDTRLPFNNGGVFADSMLAQISSNSLITTYSVNSNLTPQGLRIDNNASYYQFGDIDGASGNNLINIDSSNNELYIYSQNLLSLNASQKIELNADESISLNGLLTSVSAGGFADLHLKLTINGTRYKIKLQFD
jgi:hypothetical protein